MAAERRLVLDANILMRAVLGHRVRQIIETHFEHATFFAPEVAFADAERHLPTVIRKRGGDDAAAHEALETLATALALDCPVWTEDSDFFGTGVPTWTSDRVELYLNAKE